MLNIKSVFRKEFIRRCLVAIAILSIPSLVMPEENYPQHLDAIVPKNVYWGDMHLHTNLSVDAYVFGNTGVGPDEAYRFAQGETVKASNGMWAKLDRPLDFLVLADHGFNLGLMEGLQSGNSELIKTDSGQRLNRQYKNILKGKGPSIWTSETDQFVRTIYNEGGVSSVTKLVSASIWEKVTLRADQYNHPGKFTTFIGYEWTSSGLSPSGNLHRVVVFEGDAETVKETLPYTVFDSSDPEDLWSYLEDYEERTGSDVLAIAHNGNLSNGEMFPLNRQNGAPVDINYADLRSRWEPLYEVTQIKGDSETHPLLSSLDTFADYETWDGWEGRDITGETSEALTDKKASEYARSALMLGMSLQLKAGKNPFKFGMIGGTDSHTGLTTADENNYWGKFAESSEPSFSRIVTPSWKPFVWKYGEKPLNWGMSAAGYTGVWAHENSRESLFAAMKRKEVYASTGPRITVRFFGGWDYKPDDALRSDLAQIGYSKGVPMGGDLTSAAKGKAPTFLIRAVKDPLGANLDRIQVIKGWHDSQGQVYEKIYNVALSDGRAEDDQGFVKAVGSTVDVNDASYTNSIGDPELAVVWQDPEFDRDELAFYYLRILEIPTPRWTAYDAKFFGLEGLPKEIPMVTQERAYSSPIWYTPQQLIPLQN